MKKRNKLSDLKVFNNVSHFVNEIEIYYRICITNYILRVFAAEVLITISRIFVFFFCAAQNSRQNLESALSLASTRIIITIGRPTG